MNANLDKDQAIRDVAVNQARQFSRICNVYAPMYRQYTLDALDDPMISDEVRDIAYNSALGAWNDYLKNYNKGRGVVIIGHSQGSSHMSRLIAEEVDNDPSVRKLLISAILPGANVYVPKGGVVGGQFQYIPACAAGDQVGCVIAYSMFYDGELGESRRPYEGSAFSWIDTGYWVNPAPRPDKDLYQVLCVNPGELAGDGGLLRPLANLSVFTGNPESAKPWDLYPDFYRGECRTAEDPTKGTVSWLNVENVKEPGDARPDLAKLVGRGPGDQDLHTGDINLALDSLVSVAASQSRVYVAAERATVVRQRAALRRRTGAVGRIATRLRSQAAGAARSCRRNRKACARSKSLRRRSTQASRRVASLRKADRALTRKINSLVGPQA